MIRSAVTSLIIGIVVSIAILIYCSWRFEFVFKQDRLLRYCMMP